MRRDERKSEKKKRTRQARNFFISCSRARTLFNMISVHIVCIYVPASISKYMHMRSVFGVAVAVLSGCIVYIDVCIYRCIAFDYHPHSRILYSIVSLHSHIHQEATHKYVRTLNTNNDSQENLVRCLPLFFSLCFSTHSIFVGEAVVVVDAAAAASKSWCCYWCAFFKMPVFLSIFILFTSYCCCVRIYSGHRSEMKCLYVL